MRSPRILIPVLALALAVGAGAVQAQTQTLVFTGINYTKWLWGSYRFDGSLYNFTSIPGEGFGDNGQGTEFELLVHSKPSRYIEVTGRLKARFNQNFWTNFGGFGNPVGGQTGSGDCIGGDCGEFDPRSAEYVKFRGLTVTLTPGYKLLDTVTIGSTDLGMFDPFTIGKIRYIDRDNGKALIFQGTLDPQRKLGYDFIRISLPRLWAGPNFNTGDYTSADAAYGLQLRYEVNPKLDLIGIYEYVNDIEVDSTDIDFDDGRDITTRFRNGVAGVKVGIHPNATVDVRAAVYSSTADSNCELGLELGAPCSFGIAGFSAVPAGKLDDEAYKLNVDLNDPFGNGLSFNLEYFDIGAEYVSMMAARRESDVLLTEGHDGTFAWPGPDNVSFGVFNKGNLRIGYGGWQGNAQQVATVNVDNEFTDFEEPLAETVIGWKGFTITPTWSLGALDLRAEYSYIDYNTNWQAWNDPTRSLDDSPYPNHESDAAIASYRNAYAAFQDKETQIAVLGWKYFIPVGNGIELFGKLKWIDEEDKRMNDARFLPFQPGDCPGGGAACANNTNVYGSDADGNQFSSAAWYFNPPVITVNGVTGYQWKPFDSLSDDDRDLDYKLYQIGAGSQLSTRLYGSLTYEYYDIDLKDGNTAFQAYNLHEMVSGQHEKNKVMLYLRYLLGGAEFGFHYEYNFGEFDPDFGDGFVVQLADEGTAQQVAVPVDSPGFRGRFGGWNPLFKREFDHQRIKAFMKVRF